MLRTPMRKALALLLDELADEPDVIALGLHVDYWDHVGWIGPFEPRRPIQHQRESARTPNSSGPIYTP